MNKVRLSAVMTDSIVTCAVRLFTELNTAQIETLLDVNKKLIGNPPHNRKLHQLFVQWCKKGEVKRIIVGVSRTPVKSENTVLNLHTLAGHLVNINQYKWAERIYHKALEVSQVVFGPEQLQTAIIMADLAGVLYLLGEAQQGLSLTEKAITLFEVDNSEDSKFYLSRALANLGQVYSQSKQHTQALDYYLQALSLREVSEGQSSPKTLGLLHMIAFLLIDMDEHVEAIPYFERAFLGHWYINGPKHEHTVNSLKMIIATLNATSEKMGDDSIYEKYIHYLHTFNEIA